MSKWRDLSWAGKLAIIAAGFGMLTCLSFAIALFLLGLSSINEDLYRLSDILGWGSVSLLSIGTGFGLAAVVAYLVEND